jgi:16S rRNA G966 N2-methylase RsmD
MQPQATAATRCRRDARRYRRKGLDRAAEWIVEAASRGGIEGRTVLEPGGGVGAIQLELLKAGAERSVVVELSHEYDEAAEGLAREAGMEGRIERRHGDFAADGVGEADVVVLHRVVCCYADYERLLRAAAEKARRRLVFTYPPRNLVSRGLLGLVNLWLRLRRSDFRTFAHPPEDMFDVVRGAGFEPFDHRRGGVWRGIAFDRQ